MNRWTALIRIGIELRRRGAVLASLYGIGHRLSIELLRPREQLSDSHPAGLDPERVIRCELDDFLLTLVNRAARYRFQRLIQADAFDCGQSAGLVLSVAPMPCVRLLDDFRVV